MDQRSKLLDSAIQLFSSRGYDAVGVLEIAQSVGVTKPTLYHYFGSKAGLLEALFDENLNAFYDELSSASDYRGDLPKTLSAIVSVYFDFAQRNPVFVRMLLSNYFAPSESDTFAISKEHYKRQYEVVEQVFASAAGNHGNMRGRQKRYTFTFIGMINSYLSMFLNGQIELTNKTKGEVVQQFSHGIYS